MIFKVLVTGGSGFIGEKLIDKLTKNNQLKVFNLDKISYASKWKSEISKKNNLFKSFNIDLNNRVQTTKVIKEVDPDIIFHLAAETHVDNSIETPINFLNSNVIGTFNLLEAVTNNLNKASSLKRKNFKFIHISTDEVYGSLGDHGFFSEKTPYNPSSPYSATKASSDHLVNAWNKTYKLPAIITNCSNNYGPGQYFEKLIPKVIINCLIGKQIPLYGDGSNIRDWIYVEDHVDALIKIMKKGNPGDKYCIGANNQLTNKKIIQIICSKLDQKIPKKNSYSKLVQNVTDRVGHDYRYAINTSKVSSELGWKANTSFDKGIDLTIDWYIKNFEDIKVFLKT